MSRTPTLGINAKPLEDPAQVESREVSRSSQSRQRLAQPAQPSLSQLHSADSYPKGPTTESQTIVGDQTRRMPSKTKRGVKPKTRWRKIANVHTTNTLFSASRGYCSMVATAYTGFSPPDADVSGEMGRGCVNNTQME